MSAASTKMTEAALTGIALQLMRTACDMTQREVAREVGISASQLGRIERGETTAWGAHYVSLLDFLSTTLAERSWRLARGTELRLVQ